MNYLISYQNQLQNSNLLAGRSQLVYQAPKLIRLVAVSETQGAKSTAPTEISFHSNHLTWISGS